MTYIYAFIIFSVAAFIDLRHNIIPNTLSTAMLLIGIVACLLGEQSFSVAFGSALAVFVLFMAVCLITDFMGYSGIGGGDIKLITASAFTLGLTMTLAILLISQALAGGYLLLGRGDRGRNTLLRTVPMAPFFLVGYTIYLITVII